MPTHVPLNSIFTGNILTVADDLLKNDGQKFLEMMEQLAERRMQREQQAAQDLEEDSDADHAEEGDDEDDEDDDDDDDDEEEDEEEEVCCVALPPFCDANLCRRSPRIKRWRRANACFQFLPHACLSNECSRRTGKRSRRSVKCSCFASLRTRTKRLRTARHAKLRKIRRRRTNGGPYPFNPPWISLLLDDPDCHGS